MRSIVCIMLCLSFWFADAQSGAVAFSALSGPEKWWVVCHPFRASKARQTTREVLHVTDSIAAVGILGKDANGGQLDAFKHAYWMAALSERIGQKSALKLGRAHEKGNYRSFKKGRPEDGFLPDRPSSEMDLFNNAAGAAVSQWKKQWTKQELIGKILDMTLEGQLRVLKKEGGYFYSCDGHLLDLSELAGYWENGKCLVPSDQKQ